MCVMKQTGCKIYLFTKCVYSISMIWVMISLQHAEFMVAHRGGIMLSLTILDSFPSPIAS